MSAILFNVLLTWPDSGAKISRPKKRTDRLCFVLFSFKCGGNVTNIFGYWSKNIRNQFNKYKRIRERKPDLKTGAEA
jgi:hypothetical protein